MHVLAVSVDLLATSDVERVCRIRDGQEAGTRGTEGSARATNEKEIGKWTGDKERGVIGR